MTSHDTLLIFRIDRIACAVAAESVQSIVMPPVHLTQPPGSDKARPGIFRQGEHVFSVIDLHQLFGIETPRKGVGRLLLYEKGIRRYALWVDEVVGLARHEEGEWAALPPDLPTTLFQNGFLYRKEIVLCTTLDALLQMQDAEAIRLHLQALQPTEPENQAVAEAAPPEAETPPVEERKPAPVIEQPRQATTPKNASATTVRPTTPPKAASAKTHSAIPKAVSAAPKPLPERPAAPVRRPGKLNVPKKPAHSPIPVSPTTDPVTPTYTPHNNPSSAGPLWLLLIALILAGGGIGGYLLWEKISDNKKMMVKAPAPLAPPVIIREPTPAPVVAVEETQADGPPKPVVESNAVKQEPEQPAETESVLAKEAAIQIETDNEGTISLIIERDRLRPIPAPQTETLPPSPAVDKPMQEISETERPPEKNASLSAAGLNEEETPLVPDSDWPQPASLPEPCDCTHIVVKGDTLWDIAAKYTNNAFNYPELARQSGIRNPHRIYPGNKVRIIVR